MKTLHRNLALVRVSDAAAEVELRALVPIDRYVIGRLSSTELLVDPSRLRELLDVMESRGLVAMVRRSAVA